MNVRKYTVYPLNVFFREKYILDPLKQFPERISHISIITLLLVVVFFVIVIFVVK